METTHDELAAPVDTSSPPPLAIHVGGRKYTVEPADAPITIGREFPARVQIDDPAISRTHVRLEAVSGRWVATDSSSNGTFLDGTRQSAITITDGMTIHLSDAHGIAVFFTFTEPTAGPQTMTGRPAAGGHDEGADWTGEHDNTDPGITRAGAAVASRRVELDLSQRTLAKEKIMNAGALIAFEKGRSWPRQSTLAKLDEALQWAPGTIARIRY
jgi:hypothetical protein